MFKPRLGAWYACMPPWPNVAPVLQYFRALRVTSVTPLTKKKKKIIINTCVCFFFFAFVAVSWCPYRLGGTFAAWMPERSKGADLRSAGRKSAWVRTPLQAYVLFYTRVHPWFAEAALAFLPRLHGLMDKAHPS